MSKIKNVQPALWVTSPINKSAVSRADHLVSDIIIRLNYVIKYVRFTNKPAIWLSVLGSVYRYLGRLIDETAYSKNTLGRPPYSSNPIIDPDSELPF